MVLLQNVNDGLAKAKDAVTMIVNSSGMNVELWGSIAMPIIILVFCSLAKYTIGVGLKEIKWFDLFAEMAIDVLTIFGTFVIGRYFLLTSSQSVLMSSSGKIGIMAVAIVIVAVFRRFANQFLLRSKPSYCGAGIMLFLEYLFDVLCIVLIFKV